jgi:hypothetical protein
MPAIALSCVAAMPSCGFSACTTGRCPGKGKFDGEPHTSRWSAVIPERPLLQSLALFIGGADDHDVLGRGALVAQWGAQKFGGAAWLLWGLFCPVLFFPPLF